MFDQNSNSVENFVKILENLNMKATAESFKNEFNNIAKSQNKTNNDKFSPKNIINQLTFKINQMTEVQNTSIGTLLNKEEISTQKLNIEEATKIMDNLVTKLIKKHLDDKDHFNFTKESSQKQNYSSFNKDDMLVEGITDKSSQVNNMVNSKVFQNLMKNFDHKLFSQNTLRETQEIQFNDKVVDGEEDLPHFGGTAEKNKTNVGNEIDEIMMTDNPVNSFNNTLQPHSVNENAKSQTIKSTPMNPNNSFKCEESNMNEDSIFTEIDENNNPNVNNKISTLFQPNKQLDNIINSNLNNNIFSIINTNQDNLDTSSFFHNSQSIIMQHDDSHINYGTVDEYVDDDDPGYDLFECEVEFFKETCKKLAEQYDFTKRATYKSKFKNNENLNKEQENNMKSVYSSNNEQMKSIKVKDGEHVKSKKNEDCESLYEVENHQSSKSLAVSLSAKKSLLSNNLNFMPSGDPYYPIQHNNMIMDCFNLKVIVDRERTGFEETKDFKVVINSLIAGRYQVLQYLGSAAFSKAIKCLDIVDNKLVCLKIIENNKDYVDQSFDEIKLLRLINANGNCDEYNFLKLYDYFYHKEHLFIVTELLKDNLYEFYKYLNENNMQNYFSLDRLQKISKQILKCLEFIHGLKLIHCDLKPENILIKSISEVSVKVIDFGSSCFIYDHLSSYIQSRSYRAPEVILGCKYDYKIDIWSLGCIIAELYTGNVLFQNDSIQSLLARIMGIVGPFPDWMLERGKLVNDFFTKERLIYMQVTETDNTDHNAFNSLSKTPVPRHSKHKKMHILVPKKTQLKKRLKTNDEMFIDFVKSLLEIDPNLRLSASEALKHPWITQTVYN